MSAPLGTAVPCASTCATVNAPRVLPLRLLLAVLPHDCDGRPNTGARARQGRSPGMLCCASILFAGCVPASTQIRADQAGEGTLGAVQRDMVGVGAGRASREGEGVEQGTKYRDSASTKPVLKTLPALKGKVLYRPQDSLHPRAHARTHPLPPLPPLCESLLPPRLTTRALSGSRKARRTS